MNIYPGASKFVSAIAQKAMTKPKPKLRISQKQWQKLLERVTTRESGSAAAKIDPGKQQTLDFVMSQQPPTERLYGRIEEPIMSAGMQVGRQPRDYPYAEAALKYLKGSRAGQDIKPGGYAPPADVLSGGGQNLQYERRIFKPVEDPVRRAEKAAADVSGKLQEETVQQTPETVDYIRKSGELKQRGQSVIESVKKVQKIREAPSDELIKMGMLGDRMWKFIGGKRTLTGRMWDQFRQNARSGRKVDDTRDYFIRQFLRWSQDPEQFAKRSPQEAKSMKVIWDEFKGALGD